MDWSDAWGSNPHIPGLFPLSYWPTWNGAQGRVRTGDARRFRATLYRLSYLCIEMKRYTRENSVV